MALVAFYLLVLVVIPTGYRDIRRLFRELRKTHPDLKFIFVSGYAEEAFAKNLPEEDREKFGFLPKPFSLKQLASTVKEMLES